MALSLVAIRKDRGLTQAQAANAIGVNLPTYIAWEKMSAEDVAKIAAVFKVSTRDIRIPK